MSPAMQRVLDVLREHAPGDIQPTMVEIGARLGITKAAVHHSVSELERRGYLVRDVGRKRGMRLCAPPLGHVTSEAMIDELARRGIAVPLPDPVCDAPALGVPA